MFYLNFQTVPCCIWYYGHVINALNRFIHGDRYDAGGGFVCSVFFMYLHVLILKLMFCMF